MSENNCRVIKFRSSARSPALRTKRKVCFTSYTYTSSNHGSSVLRNWPTWPIHICRPIWPMTRDRLTHCMLWHHH